MAIKSDSARFESWPNGLALYIDDELKASCVLGHMRSTDLEDLEYFDLSAISDGTLRIRKKILRYGYNDENSFVKLLEELKKRTTVYISMHIDDENQRLFGKAGYCGRWDCQSYDSDSKILFVSHTQKKTRKNTTPNRT